MTAIPIAEYGPFERHGRKGRFDKRRAGKLLGAAFVHHMTAGHRGRGHGFGRHFDPREAFSMRGFGFGPPGRGGRRARRGDVRAAALLLLEEQPRNGYQLMQEIEERSGGAWRPSPGSIYPTLQLLEDEGLVTGEESGGKRRFSLTDAGRAEADGLDRPPWEQITDEGAGHASSLRDSAFQLGAAIIQVARTGSEDQIAKTRDILNDARRRVYTVLGEDGEA
jgi:DNA-binding PadR family transcriptional regulator